VGVLLLGPAISYCQYLQQGGARENYADFWIHRDLPSMHEQFHYWFLGVLFVFASLAWLGRRALGAQPPMSRLRARHPGVVPLAWLYGYGALMGGLVLLVSEHQAFDRWIDAAGVLQFQPTRIPIYAGFSSLAWSQGLRAGDRRAANYRAWRARCP
jgi:hypothetical protein